MTHTTSRSVLVALGLLLTACALLAKVASAAPAQSPDWSRLAGLPAGTPIVVTLADGRHLQRLLVSAETEALVVVDLGRIASRDDRNFVSEQLRSHPAMFTRSASIRQDGHSIDVVERFDRRSILTVARPGSRSWEPRGAMRWLLASSGPCPNCDPRQTLSGDAVYPSPLPANRESGAAMLYAAAPGSVAGQQKPEKKAPNVTGKWAMTLEMSMGTGTPSLDLKQDGTKISGTYTGRYGTFELQGTLKERAIQFSFTMSAEGQAVTMTFAGEVAEDGQTMKGTATLGEMGDATWSTKRGEK